MSETRDIEGRCLCGVVTVRAELAKPIIRACHCDMCRRQNSGPYMSVPTVPGSVTASGPVKSFRSSDWAERAFCATCGSTLWYMTVADQQRQVSAGLFDNAAGATLKLEFFSDMKPDGYAFTGDHRRLSTAETIALFAPQEGDTA